MTIKGQSQTSDTAELSSVEGISVASGHPLNYYTVTAKTRVYAASPAEATWVVQELLLAPKKKCEDC
jgi:hypothetical protein